MTKNLDQERPPHRPEARPRRPARPAPRRRQGGGHQRTGAGPDGFSDARSIDAAGRIVCPGLSISRRTCPASKANSPPPSPAASPRSPARRTPARRSTNRASSSASCAAADAGLACVLPVGALTVGLKGEALAELGSLARAGCVAFSQGSNSPIVDTQVLLRALQYATTFGYPLLAAAAGQVLARDGVAHDGEVASRLGLPGIPAAAESVAIATALNWSAAPAPACTSRASSAAGVALLQRARDEGLR